jgi:hypothetical protein
MLDRALVRRTSLSSRICTADEDLLSVRPYSDGWSVFPLILNSPAVGVILRPLTQTMRKVSDSNTILENAYSRIGRRLTRW